MWASAREGTAMGQAAWMVEAVADSDAAKGKAGGVTMSPAQLRKLLSRANPKSASVIRQQLAVPRKGISQNNRQKLERKFDDAWETIGGPELEREVRFDAVRKWRFDRAHVAAKVAIECVGGTFIAGGHSRGAAFERDREKFTAAQEQGWLVYELTVKQITTDWARRILENIERRLRKCA